MRSLVLMSLVAAIAPSGGAIAVFDGWFSTDASYAYGYVKNVGSGTANKVNVVTQGPSLEGSKPAGALQLSPAPLVSTISGASMSSSPVFVLPTTSRLNVCHRWGREEDRTP